MLVSPNGKPVFPLGMYEQPRTEEEWQEWSQAGINLLRCGSREELDQAHERGMMGWVPVRMVVRSDEDARALAENVDSLRDHPALAVWEAPDESIWEACRLPSTGKVTTRPWAEPPEVRKLLKERIGSLVRDLKRGSDIVRERDPRRKIWLNEACKSDQDTLARLVPFLDIVGYDYYPIPVGQEEGRAMPLLGGYTDRYRRTAPAKDLWVVEQAFSWSNIRPESGRPEAYPNVEEYRFMAWEAIAHGATGLLWWGSGHETRPAPFLHDLMTVVGELKELHPFLVAGDVGRVHVSTAPRQNPAVAGAAGVVRRSPDGTMLALINQDPHEHDVIVPDLDWVNVDDLVPFTPAPGGFTRVSEGWITPMAGHEVRVYLSG
jgi:hypothetical protein